uniref:Uncharacterized protein n=1 Tax=Babesia bovis TaxID=5865 RepID=S6BHU3_BABBO|nr:hypothetical protein [Babesia bovis]
MESWAEGLNISSHFGPAIFYMILGWITAQLKLTDVDHYDIVTSYSLTDSNDGKLAQIFKYVVHMVICMAGQKLLSDESVQHYDNDLRWLLHNGTVSGIYNRLNMLTKCSANFYGVYTDTVIISTIAMELHKLSRSRQVTFTRLIQHITDNLIGSANPGYNTAPRKQNQRLWNLLSQGVNKSGIKQLAYDNINLLRSMRSLGREFDIMPLAKVLAQGTTSHVNDLEDFRKNCDYMSAVCALKKHGITWDYFDTFNLQRDNMGVILLIGTF